MNWAAVLAEHDRWLRTALLARLGERHAVDEVMQEVAAAALAQRTGLQDPTRAGAWLYRVSLRMVLHYRRRCGRQRKLVGAYAKVREAAISAPGDALDWLIRDERAKLIRQALALLPRRDAEILMLKYTENWSCRELAQHLGASPNAIESRLHRARQRLREAIANTGVI